MTTDDDGPLVYYRLTLWAFGSGELKIWAKQILVPKAPVLANMGNVSKNAFYDNPK